MKKFLLSTLIFLLITMCLYAQQAPTISVASVTSYANTSISLPVNFTTGTTGVSTLQFDLTLPAGVTSPSPAVVTTGQAATLAGKTASANVLPSGAVRILLFGLNQNVIQSGNIVNVSLNIGVAVPVGSFTVNIGNIVCANPAGNNVPTTGVPGTIVVILRDTTIYSPINVKIR